MTTKLAVSTWILGDLLRLRGPLQARACAPRGPAQGPEAYLVGCIFGDRPQVKSIRSQPSLFNIRLLNENPYSELLSQTIIFTDISASFFFLHFVLSGIFETNHESHVAPFAQRSPEATAAIDIWSLLLVICSISLSDVFKKKTNYADSESLSHMKLPY